LTYWPDKLFVNKYRFVKNHSRHTISATVHIKLLCVGERASLTDERNDYITSHDYLYRHGLIDDIKRNSFHWHNLDTIPNNKSSSQNRTKYSLLYKTPVTHQTTS